MKEVRLIFVWGAITLLLVSTAWDSNMFGLEKYTPSDDQGPEFLDVGYRFSDIKYTTGMPPLNLTLGLSVRVRDPDGIDTVIGSYRLKDEISWNNLTLSLNETYENYEYRYLGYGLSFILDLDNRVVAWDERFYANDTLGNWNASEIGGHSYALLNLQHSLDVTLIIGAIVGIGMLALVVVVFIQKKRMTT